MLGWFLLCNASPLLPEPLSHPTCYPTHLGCHRASSWVSGAIRQLPTGYLFYTFLILPFYTWECIYVNGTPSARPTLSFFCSVHKSFFYICRGSLSSLMKPGKTWKVSACMNYTGIGKVNLKGISEHATSYTWRRGHRVDQMDGSIGWIGLFLPVLFPPVFFSFFTLKSTVPHKSWCQHEGGIQCLMNN